MMRIKTRMRIEEMSRVYMHDVDYDSRYGADWYQTKPLMIKIAMMRLRMRRTFFMRHSVSCIV